MRTKEENRLYMRQYYWLNRNNIKTKNNKSVREWRKRNKGLGRVAEYRGRRTGVKAPLAVSYFDLFVDTSVTLTAVILGDPKSPARKETILFQPCIYCSAPRVEGGYCERHLSTREEKLFDKY